MKRSWVSHFQVGLQFAGIALSCYPVGLINTGSAWWLVACLIGSAFGIWALYHNPIGNFSVYPEPKSRALLVTSGPYRLVRHPMYGALLVMMLGIVGYNGHGLNLLGFALVVAAVSTKAVREEAFLKSKFPEYGKYMHAKRRFIPFVY